MLPISQNPGDTPDMPVGSATGNLKLTQEMLNRLGIGEATEGQTYTIKLRFTGSDGGTLEAEPVDGSGIQDVSSPMGEEMDSPAEDTMEETMGEEPAETESDVLEEPTPDNLPPPRKSRVMKPDEALGKY